MFQELFIQLSTLGYLGIFLISLIGSSTVIFPLPAAAFVFGAAVVLNPLVLGIVAGLGASLGELIGYGIGWSGQKFTKKYIKNHIEERLEKAREMFKKYGGFFVILVFAATPLPDDIVGIVGGVLKYDIKKFFVAVLIGKTVFHLILAFAGYYGINGALNYFF